MIQIIIPNYGNAALLDQCLKSLFKVESNLDPILVHVVDDCSPQWEQVKAVCEQHQVNFHKNTENRGFSTTCNSGLTFIGYKDDAIIVNSDILFKAPFIKEFEKALDKDPKIGIVGALLYFPDSKIQHCGVAFTKNIDGSVWVEHPFRNQPISDGHPALNSNYHVAVTAALVAIKRDMITDIGGFDERWGMAYEDVELCLRAWQKGWKVYLTNKVRATHLEGATRGRNKEEKLAKNPMMWYKEEMAIKKTRRLLSRELVASVEQKVALERRRL